MEEVLLFSESGKPFLMKESLEPNGKVPGYIITKEGNFLKVPDSLTHLGFFRYVLGKYSETEPPLEILEVLDSLIHQFGCSVYFGSEPTLRNFYLKGRLYVDIESITEMSKEKIQKFIQNVYEKEKFSIDVFSFPKKIDLLKENYVEKVEDLSKKR